MQKQIFVVPGVLTRGSLSVIIRLELYIFTFENKGFDANDGDTGQPPCEEYPYSLVPSPYSLVPTP